MTRPAQSQSARRVAVASDLLSRVLLAVLVVVWSIAPALPRPGVVTHAGGSPSLHSAPSVPALLVSRIDSGSLVIAGRSNTSATEDAADPFDEGTGPDLGSAIVEESNTLALHAHCAFIAPAHPAAKRLSRTLRLAGRGPPRA